MCACARAHRSDVGGAELVQRLVDLRELTLHGLQLLHQLGEVVIRQVLRGDLDAGQELRQVRSLAMVLKLAQQPVKQRVDEVLVGSSERCIPPISPRT